MSKGSRPERRFEGDPSLLYAAVEHLNQAFSLFDQNLNLVFCNKHYLTLLDFPEEMGTPGTPLSDFFRYNAERGEYGPGNVEDLVSERVELAMKFEPHKFERERLDGIILLIEGNPVNGGGFVTTYTDITSLRRSQIELEAAQEDSQTQIALLTEQRKELAKSEHQLQQERRLLADVGRLTKTGGWELNAKTMELTWSDKTYRIHEVPIGAPLITEEAINFYIPEDRPRIANAVQKGLELGQSWDLEATIVTGKGNRKIVRAISETLTENGEVLAIRGTFQDITERWNITSSLNIALQRAEEANRSKTAFLAAMSHEFRTPLNAPERP